MNSILHIYGHLLRALFSFVIGISILGLYPATASESTGRTTTKTEWVSKTVEINNQSTSDWIPWTDYYRNASTQSFSYLQVLARNALVDLTFQKHSGPNITSESLCRILLTKTIPDDCDHVRIVIG